MRNSFSTVSGLELHDRHNAHRYHFVPLQPWVLSASIWWTESRCPFWISPVPQRTQFRLSRFRICSFSWELNSGQYGSNEIPPCHRGWFLPVLDALNLALTSGRFIAALCFALTSGRFRAVIVWALILALVSLVWILPKNELLSPVLSKFGWFLPVWLALKPESFHCSIMAALIRGIVFARHCLWTLHFNCCHDNS